MTTQPEIVTGPKAGRAGGIVTALRRAAQSFSFYLAIVVEVVAGVLLCLVTAFVFIQVVFRYVLGLSLEWTEELARYTAIWSALLGAALGVRSRLHFRILFLVTRFSTGAQAIVTRAVDVAIAAFLIVFVVSSGPLLAAAADQESPGARIPLLWVYLSGPVSAVLMLVFMACEVIGGGWRRLSTEVVPDEALPGATHS
jgi:TRAP-type C4-dicarboxylate transport system permease small subunit